MHASWVLFFTAIVAGSLSVNGQINVYPGDVTAQIGGNVTLKCEVTNPSVFTEWLSYAASPVGITIFNTDTGVTDSTKYEVEGEYDLMIKNLVLADGGFYGCKVAGMAEAARADVVVIEEPVPSSDELFAGETAIATCSTKYQSASHDNIDPNHIPQAEAYVYDDTRITDHETIRTDSYYEIKIAVNYTAAVSDNGRDLTCRVYTVDPPYEDISTMTLDVKYAVNNLEFAPRNEFYFVGEYVNCTAEGNPKPDYEWMPLSSAGAAPVLQSTLHIVSTMVGFNEWKCFARNTVKEGHVVEDTITFEVMENDGGEGGEVGPAPTEAWVIAVAVIVPLLVIVFVVLVFVFWKKRKAPQQSKPKSPQTNPNFEESSGSNEDEEYPAARTNGKPQPTQYARPLPPVQAPFYGANPAVRAGYDPSKQSSHGRSPGYADLGIKHIPAYAQPPSLNSSMDLNPGMHPNGFNGQHINPNPYSRAPIVMGAPGNPNMGMNQKRKISQDSGSVGGETGV